MTTKRLLLGAGALLGVLLLGWVALLLFGTTVLPRLGLAPGFALTAEDGRPLTSEDLRGSLVLYSFAHAGCRSAVCDESAALLRAVQQRLEEAALRDVPVRLVTVSVDPADTPAALQALARRWGANPVNWAFAAGERETLPRVLRDGFGVHAERAAGGDWAFDPMFVVVDGWGIVRARYRVGLPAPEFLLRDLRLAAREARAASGATRYAYEMAHLFSCASGGG